MGNKSESTVVCQDCKHYLKRLDGRCSKCGCKNHRYANGSSVIDQDMVVLEGSDLNSFLTQIQTVENQLGGINKMRVSWYGDTVTFKFNEYSWSPPMGKIQEPY